MTEQATMTLLVAGFRHKKQKGEKTWKVTNEHFPGFCVEVVDYPHLPADEVIKQFIEAFVDREMGSPR